MKKLNVKEVAGTIGCVLVAAAFTALCFSLLPLMVWIKAHESMIADAVLSLIAQYGIPAAFGAVVMLFVHSMVLKYTAKKPASRPMATYVKR